jgi:dUTP pyrophosphatase
MNSVEVKIINKSNNPNPSYATSQSAGMDVRANLPHKTIIITPNSLVLIPTGIYVELPEGYEMQVRSRSGLALKNKVIVFNAPGTIDADYRGEVGVILYNGGDTDFTVNNGDRIAQLVVCTCSQAKFVNVDTLDETERGNGGYGHTGVE